MTREAITVRVMASGHDATESDDSRAAVITEGIRPRTPHEHPPVPIVRSPADGVRGSGTACGPRRSTSRSDEGVTRMAKKKDKKKDKKKKGKKGKKK